MLRMLRRGLQIGSAALFIASGLQFYISDVRAQGERRPIIADTVAVVMPKGGDARALLHYDPYVNTVDAVINDVPAGSAVDANTGAVVVIPTPSPLLIDGPGIGVPDIAFGQPIATTSLTNGAPVTFPVNGNKNGVVDPPSPQPSSQYGVHYVGRITGVPPIAVLRWSNGATRIIHLHQRTTAGKVVTITADYVRFASGLTLIYDPTPLATTTSSTPPTPMPAPFVVPTAAPAPLGLPTLVAPTPQPTPFAPASHVRLIPNTAPTAAQNASALTPQSGSPFSSIGDTQLAPSPNSTGGP